MIIQDIEIQRDRLFSHLECTGAHACTPLCYHGDFEITNLQIKPREKSEEPRPREEVVVLYFNIQHTAIDLSVQSQCSVDRRGCGYISSMVAGLTAQYGLDEQ